MYEIVGPAFTCCDHMPRRSFLRAGFLSLGGLHLSQLLARRAGAGAAPESEPETAVIYVELAGGPSQFETYDPKPSAPSECRGPFPAISTNLPGVCVSSLMGHQARIMDKLAVVRSVHHQRSAHDPSSHLVQTGYYKRGPKGSANEMPSIGSVAARLRGANARGMPAYVAIPRVMRNGGAAYLGSAYLPFETGGDPNQSPFRVRNLSFSKQLSGKRLDDRTALLREMDDHRRMIDLRGNARAMDRFTARAVDMLTGDRARKAFDIAWEDDRLRDAYGRTTAGQSMLLARRLVEAGATLVTVRVGGWDDHQDMVPRLKARAPAYDRAIAALVQDLCARGLDRQVLVVAMGEFGRTPRINRNAGRDHWPSVMSVLMAGGALRVGQVVGSSSPKGDTPRDRPYRPEDILCMIYRHLDIDPGATLPDFSGRPRHVLQNGGLVHELI